MSAASIYIPRCFAKRAARAQDLHDTLVGAAYGVALAAAVFGFAELVHHSGHNPFLDDEPAVVGEVA